MSKWLSASALALLLAVPAFAQSADRTQSQGIESANPKPSGDYTPPAAAESKTSGQAIETAKTPDSGASASTRPADRPIGTAKPSDDNAPAEAYKKDFEKK